MKRLIPVLLTGLFLAACSNPSDSTATIPIVSPSYAISVTSPANGTVTASATLAAAGETVTLTVTPNAGYTLSAGTLAFTPTGGTATAIDETSLTFTMPAAAVTISASFVHASTYHLALHPSWSYSTASASLNILLVKDSIAASLPSSSTLYSLLSAATGNGYRYSTSATASFYVNPSAITAGGITPTNASGSSSLTGVTVKLDASGNYLLEVDYSQMTLSGFDLNSTSTTAAVSTLMDGYTPFVIGNILYYSTDCYTYSGTVKAMRLLPSGEALNTPTAAPTCTVSFNSNGGSAVAAQTITVGTMATKPTNPTLTGKEFLGWYSDASLTTLASFSASIKADTTFYARWSSGPLLSQGCTVTSSSDEATTYAKEYAVDSSLSSRWSSGNESTSWICLDLGSVTSVTDLRLTFEAGSSAYTIQYSGDGTTWTDSGSTYSSSTASIKVLSFTTALSARYLKLISTGNLGTVGNVSLYDFSIYGN